MSGILSSISRYIPHPFTAVKSPELFLKAAEEGNLAELTRQIKAGVSLTSQNNIQETALHLAVSKGHLEIVKKLISTCPQLIEMENDENETPIFYARGECLKALIEAGANIFHKDIQQQTPLHRMAQHGLKDEVAMLLARSGALRDNKIDEALLDKIYPDLLTLIRSYDTSPVDLADKHGKTPLFMAVKGDFMYRQSSVTGCPFPSVVELLLKYKANPNHLCSLEKGKTMSILNYVKSLKGPTRNFIPLFEEAIKKA